MKKGRKAGGERETANAAINGLGAGMVDDGEGEKVKTPGTACTRHTSVCVKAFIFLEALHKYRGHQSLLLLFFYGP